MLHGMRTIQAAIAFLVLALGQTSCGSSMRDCGMHKIPNMDTHHYDVDVDSRTPAGIPVDTGGVKRDLSHIDAMALEVKACLAESFPGLRLTDEVLDATYCPDKDFSSSYNAAFKYGCWQVKIDNKWVKSCDGKQQLLEATPPMMPGQTCGGKPGTGSTEECPCHYRVAVTGKTLIVPPDARLFKDGLVRAITGCQNPWAHPLLAKCARPSS